MIVVANLAVPENAVFEYGVLDRRSGARIAEIEKLLGSGVAESIGC